MRTKATKYFKNNSAGTDHLLVDSFSNEEMIKEYKTVQVRHLFNTDLAVAKYSQSEGLIENLFVQQFSRYHIKLKYITGWKYFQGFNFMDNWKLKRRPCGKLPSTREVLYLSKSISVLDFAVSS